MRGRGIKGILPFFVLFLLIGTGLVVGYGIWLNRDTVIISHDSGIYTEDFLLKIDTVASAEIYYTLDGSEPAPENPCAHYYTQPVSIRLDKESADYLEGAGSRIYSLQIKAFYTDGQVSPTYKREYVIEEEGPGRYTTNYIISVTGDEAQLFDYDEGIFVRGRQYDEYMKENPDVNILSQIIPANYFSDEEVPVHVSVFSKDGEELVSKQCGLRICGNITRAKNQKSFRLYARTEYDGENEFQGEFLTKLVSDVTNTTVDEYQRLTLHNSGNDNGYGFVRSVLIGELARQYGFEDVLVGESATVYVNGKYQGVYWLENTFDDKYFKEKYGDFAGEMAVAEGALSEMNAQLAETEAERLCAEEYNAFCAWVKDADLNLEANWEKVCDTIDIYNFARYMAIEYYIGNIDWPDNNVKVYRYYASDGTYKADSVFDGKYRYILFDTDYGMGLLFQERFGYGVEQPLLQQLCAGDRQAELFSGLMRREEFKALFVHAVLSLSQGSFSLENVNKVLPELAGMVSSEITYMYEETDLMKKSLWESDENGFANVEQEWAEIFDYVNRRPDIITAEMLTVLDTGQMHELTLETLEQGIWVIGGLEVGAEYEGVCFEKSPMEIYCSVPAGYAVKGYYVNGKYIPGTALELEPAEWSEWESISVIPDVATWVQEELRIYAYDTSDGNDFIVLVNSGNSELLLSDYALSDSEEASKGRLPAILLKPGEKFYVFGKRYSGVIPENGIKVSFSWNDEENIVLTNILDGIIQQIDRKG